MSKLSRLLQEGIKQLNAEIQIHESLLNVLAVIIASVENSNTQSHLSARAELLVARKPGVHPKVFKGKTPFRDITLQVLNFVLVS